MQVRVLLLNTNPRGHVGTFICTLNSENCKLIRVVFTCKSSSIISMLRGMLCLIIS